MDRLTGMRSTGAMTTTTTTADPATTTDHGLTAVPGDLVRRAIGRRSFAVLATTSPAGRPHAAGVLYATAGGRLYVSTDRTSRKGRNLVAAPHVGVTIPVRRLPIGPPATIHFQARAEVLPVDHPDVRTLIADGSIASITTHGELDLPDGCIVRITPPATVHTYALGVSLLHVLRHPLDAAGVAPWNTAA